MNMVYPNLIRVFERRTEKRRGRLFICPRSVFLFTYEIGKDSVLRPKDVIFIDWVKFELFKEDRAICTVCVIVAPLVYLMNDQVASLQRKSIVANLHWPFY